MIPSDKFIDGLRCWAEIHIDILSENIKIIKSHIDDDTKIFAVVKADGYGHGAIHIAKAIENQVYGFCVAAIEEGLELRNAGIDNPILVLGYVHPCWYEKALLNDISLTLYKETDAVLLSEIATRNNKKCKIHIKLDTGMGRIGFRVQTEEEIVDSVDKIIKIAKLRSIEIEGLYTHFALADIQDKAFTQKQYTLFQKTYALLETMGVKIPVVHCNNSAAILEYGLGITNAVRAGIVIYGLEPSQEVDVKKYGLKPIMELKSHIIHVKEIKAGDSVGYGRTYIAEETRIIATVSIGYGDGYPRNLSNIGKVLIQGKFAPIVGRVCMDQLMVDVTAIPSVKDGDIVTIIGNDGNNAISLSELAIQAGTFNYEFACNINKRVKRMYL